MSENTVRKYIRQLEELELAAKRQRVAKLLRERESPA